MAVSALLEFHPQLPPHFRVPRCRVPEATRLPVCLEKVPVSTIRVCCRLPLVSRPPRIPIDSLPLHSSPCLTWGVGMAPFPLPC